MASRESKSSRVDRLVSGQGVAELIKKTAKRSRVDIAVAFWGNGAVEKLGLRAAKGGRIICNVVSGASFAPELRKLTTLSNFEVKMLSSLYAQAYVADNLLLAGSSNVATNGMSENKQGGTELNVCIHNHKLIEEASRWFGDLWKEAIAIEDDDLIRAEALWAAKAKCGVVAGVSGKGLYGLL